jgi:hypothetical protein
MTDIALKATLAISALRRVAVATWLSPSGTRPPSALLSENTASNTAMTVVQVSSDLPENSASTRPEAISQVRTRADSTGIRALVIQNWITASLAFF